MEDIKLLNRKVPTLVRGIQRAGLVNSRPRQRQLDQHPVVEPIAVMNVRIIDGPSNIGSLSIRPLDRRRSLEMSNSPPVPAPAIFKESSTHQNDEESFAASAAPLSALYYIRQGFGSLHKRDVPVEDAREVAGAPQNDSQEFIFQVDPPEASNDPSNISELSMSPPPPLPVSRDIAMDQVNRPHQSEARKHVQIPQRISSSRIKIVFGSLKKATQLLPLTRNITEPNPNLSGSSDIRRELLGSPPKVGVGIILSASVT